MKTLLSLLLCTVVLSSCVSYHSGMRDDANFPGIATITIVNLTKDGSLSGTMKREIYEQFQTRPGLCRRKGGEEGVNLTITLVSQDTKNIARAEMRDHLSRDKDDKAYQTVLSRVLIDAKYVVSNNEGADLLTGTVRGQGDLPWMNDQNIAYQNACKQAILDVARQMADALTDAVWAQDEK